MIKPALLIRLIKQRLAHNEAYLAQTPGLATLLAIPECDLDKTPGYRRAVEEENEYLRALLHECAHPFSDAAR